MAENGNIPAEQDTERYVKLEEKAADRKSMYPKCLAGAENYIRQ